MPPEQENKLKKPQVLILDASDSEEEENKKNDIETMSSSRQEKSLPENDDSGNTNNGSAVLNRSLDLGAGFGRQLGNTMSNSTGEVVDLSMSNSTGEVVDLSNDSSDNDAPPVLLSTGLPKREEDTTKGQGTRRKVSEESSSGRSSANDAEASAAAAAAAARNESAEEGDDDDSSDDGFWVSVKQPPSDDDVPSKQWNLKVEDMPEDSLMGDSTNTRNEVNVQRKDSNEKNESTDNTREESPIRLEAVDGRSDVTTDASKADREQDVSNQREGSNEKNGSADNTREKSPTRLEPVDGRADATTDATKADSQQKVTNQKDSSNVASTDDTKNDDPTRMEAGQQVWTNGPSGVTTDSSNARVDSQQEVSIEKDGAVDDMLEESLSKEDCNSDNRLSSGMESPESIDDRSSATSASPSHEDVQDAYIEEEELVVEVDRTSEKRTRPRRAATKSTSSSSDKIRKDKDPPSKGDRVYAKFTNNQWYWGKIGAVTKKRSTRYPFFTINFDDGDSLPDVPRRDIRTVNEYRQEWFSDTPTLSPQEMHELRCNKCELCTIPDCGHCASCRNNKTTSSDDEQEVCLQKMCLSIPNAQKKQQVEGLPDGWNYMFHTNTPYMSSRFYVPGLFIYSPDCRKAWRSMEGVLGNAPTLKSKSPNIIADFYRHIGVTKSSGNAEEASEGSKAITTASGRNAEGGLGHAACGECENCTKEACQKCAVCKSSASGASPHCFQKMCFKLPTDAKAKPAVGFPRGWRFVFAEDRANGASHRHKPIPGLYLFSPNGFKFRSVEAATSGCFKELPNKSDIARTFYTHVGLPDKVRKRDRIEIQEADTGSRRKKPKTDSSEDAEMPTDHFLVGRKLCFSWTDMKNQKKLVYGKVVECEEREETQEVVSFRVVYDLPSRALVNSMGNECAAHVPESQLLSPPLVIGGCIQFEKQLNTANQEALLQQVCFRMHKWNWITPDLRHEDLVEHDDGTRLPRLTIAVRGFQLELKVKQSLIPNAGNGVFLSCTRLMIDDGQPLELKPGELLDLGVYAPLCLADKKLEAVFFIKNFIHARKCEEWVFDAADSRYQLDITDDVTGDIHSEAKKHIHTYVNECNDDEKVCIEAQHDPEGCVHYLLGHAHESQGDFVLPSDGTEVEVFVNYGDNYERVRLRNGYSFLPDQQDESLKTIEQEDVTDVKEMKSFGPFDVSVCVEFMLALFSQEAEFKTETIRRALVCAAMLQRRARKLLVVGSDDDDSNEDDDEEEDADETPCLRVVLRHSRELMSFLLGMAQDKEMVGLRELQASGNVDRVLGRVLKMQFRDQFSTTELSELLSDME